MVHLRSSARVAVVLVAAYLALVVLVLLTAGQVSAQVGAGPVQTASWVLAVLSWALAGWAGTHRLRDDGSPRPASAATAGVGAALGYAAVPGLLGVVGLVLSGAGAVAVLGGPVLSAVLAGTVAALVAGLSPHAPPPAPYVG